MFNRTRGDQAKYHITDMIWKSKKENVESIIWFQLYKE